MNVSILTPTYNRKKFLTFLAIMIEEQTYPLDKIEWIVIDDSNESNQEWFEKHHLQDKLHRIYYQHFKNHIKIGEKRNLVKKNANGDILIHMDDDDYYGMNYVETIVNVFKKSTNIHVVGASTIYLIYPELPFLYKSGPFHKNHTCGGFMSYRKEYANNHNYNPNASKAEEKQFLNYWTTPVFQILNSSNIYMAIVHQNNTVNKYSTRRVKTDLHWISHINYPEISMFYLTLTKMDFELHYVNYSKNLMISNYSGVHSNVILRFLLIKSILKITLYFFLFFFNKIIHLYNKKDILDTIDIHRLILKKIDNKTLEPRKIKKQKISKVKNYSKNDMMILNLQKYYQNLMYSQKYNLNNSPELRQQLITYATYVRNLNR